jgi:hypothetical protein
VAASGFFDRDLSPGSWFDEAADGVSLFDSTQQGVMPDVESEAPALAFAGGVDGLWLDSHPISNFETWIDPGNHEAPINYGDLAGKWLDKSGNGHTMYCIADDARAILWDHGSDVYSANVWNLFYNTTGGGGGGTDAFYLCYSIQKTDGIQGVAFADDLDAFPNNGYKLRLGDDGFLTFSAGTGTERVSVSVQVGEPATTLTRKLIEAWHDGSTINLRVNGDVTVSAPCGTVAAGMNRIHLSGTELALDSLDQYICQLVYTKNKCPDQATRELIATHVAQRAGMVQVAPPVAITGALAAAETGDDTFVGAGAVAVAGALAVAETGNDIAAAVAAVRVAGTLVGSETGSDVFSATATSAIAGVLSVSETASDSFNASGAVAVTGSLAGSETGSDTAAASGAVRITASMAVSETGADSFSALGVVAITGELAAVEGESQDFFAASGRASIAGPIGAVETALDTFAANVVTAIDGMMGAHEVGQDSFAGVGALLVRGSFAVLEEGGDTANAIGAVLVTGVMEVVETGLDVAAAEGVVHASTSLPQPFFWNNF